MRVSRSVLGSTAVLVIAVTTGGWFLQRGVHQEQNLYIQVRLFQEVVDRVASSYVDPVERKDLYGSAIDGLIEDLGDPNTSFMPASEWDNLRIRTEGEYDGLGLEIVERGGWVTVVTAMPGSPGTRAGIRAGDQIIEVNGESAEEWDSDAAADALRGPGGTTVNVTMRRPGVETPITFEVTRGTIEIHSVPFAVMLDDKIGYLPLQAVNEGAGAEVRSALDSLLAEGMEGLVFDVRGNPGGLLDEGIAITELFLDEGAVIVETRGRAAGQSETFHAGSPAVFPDIPVVVLVNGTSASASEIIAGALQDYDRALVVGTPSYGKGSVQSLFPLTGGSALRLTTARWYTPAGRSIQKPDHAYPADMAEMGVLSVYGGVVERQDTAELPEFTTPAGRTVLGGGGIHPDVFVYPDTLTVSEHRAVYEIYRSAGRLFLALFDYSVLYLGEHTDLSADFAVSDEELRSFQLALSQREVEVEWRVFRQAHRFIRSQLEREIALQAWGAEGEFQRVRGNDLQLRRALELMGSDPTVEDLFRRAGQPLSEPVAAGSPGEALR